MTATLLILRPEPGAAATAARAEAAGFAVMTTPLFVVRPRDWTPPDPAMLDAVLLTSANAVRHAGPALAAFTGLPAFAVGAATAEAARAAGFRLVHVGEANADSLAGQAVTAGIGRALHLAGREHRPLTRDGLLVETRIVYAAAAARALSPDAVAALRGGAVALLHSPRAAALFRALVEAAGLAPDRLAVAAISPAALAAAGEGWHAVASAAAPTDDALLAAAARLCDQGARKDG